MPHSKNRKPLKAIKMSKSDTHEAPALSGEARETLKRLSLEMAELKTKISEDSVRFSELRASLLQTRDRLRACAAERQRILSPDKPA